MLNYYLMDTAPEDYFNEMEEYLDKYYKYNVTDHYADETFPFFENNENENEDNEGY